MRVYILRVIARAMGLDVAVKKNDAAIHLTNNSGFNVSAYVDRAIESDLKKNGPISRRINIRVGEQ